MIGLNPTARPPRLDTPGVLHHLMVQSVDRGDISYCNDILPHLVPASRYNTLDSSPLPLQHMRAGQV